MSAKKLRKQLRPHATTCIKKRIVDVLKASENAGLAYSVHCDRENCWDDTELLKGEMGVVNLRSERFTLTGEENRRTLSDGEGVCVQRASMELFIDVYSTNCEGTTVDIAMSILADVVRVIMSTSTSRLLVKRIDEVDMEREVDTDYADEKTKITHTLAVEFLYVPERPSLVFGTAL